MALVENDLAAILYGSLGHTQDKDGNSAVTDLMKAYAQGFCTCLKAGLVNNAPGTVTALSLPVGGPIQNGEASNGLMVLIPTLMTAITVSAFPPESTAKLTLENIAVITYIMTAGKVSFASGNITGVSTCTPLSPGPLTLGQGTGGKISGLNGDDCAAAVGGSEPDKKPFYNALVNYLMANAEVTYAPSSIQGSFPVAGGNMTSGAGVGGTIK